jgi:hypothetical protein
MLSTKFAQHVALVALVVGAVTSSDLSAQVIYEPVQYQYEAGGQHYYYGGTNPNIHRWAHTPVGGAGRWGRTNGFAFVSGNIDTHREVVDEHRVRAFTDAMPYINAHIYGFTATDARNEAYFNVPLYFRKGDLLNAAVRVNGAYVVPAQAQPIRIDRDRDGRDRPTTTPRPVMIIPKDQIFKPQPKAADKTFASAKTTTTASAKQ